jgi:hypothetical protein
MNPEQYLDFLLNLPGMVINQSRRPALAGRDAGGVGFCQVDVR